MVRFVIDDAREEVLLGRVSRGRPGLVNQDTENSQMRVCVRTLLVLACLIAAQSTAWAQATIAGAVKDSSGAVLPGVTVEASSPALIEKVRTTATDGAGRYRIEDLRPGTYVVTFTLPGFVTVRRDNVLVSGTGVIAVDGEL